MKKIMMVAITLIASVSMLSQTKTVSKKTTTKVVTKESPKVLKKDISIKIMDGMESWVTVPYKVLNVQKIDSVFNKKSYEIVEWAVMYSNLKLKHTMKDSYSFKPLTVGNNSIIYLDYEGKDYLIVEIIAQANNGYGNPISKKYSVWLTYDKTNKDLYESFTLERIL